MKRPVSTNALPYSTPAGRIPDCIASASDIERLDVKTRTPGLLWPGIALTRVSPTKNRRRCSSSSTSRCAGVALASSAVGNSLRMHPAIITTGELRPLLLCKLMMRTSGHRVGCLARTPPRSMHPRVQLGSRSWQTMRVPRVETVHRLPLALPATAQQVPERCRLGATPVFHL